MRTAIGGLVLLALVAMVATYFRYQSFDPCNWMAQDMSHHTGLPVMVMEGKVKANFLVRGITEPGPGECLMAWWGERADEAKELVRQ